MEAFKIIVQLYQQGQYATAIPLAERAVKLAQKQWGKEHPDLANHLNNLAELYESQGRYAEALEQFRASLKSEQQRLRYVFSTSSDRERREYIESNPESYYVFLILFFFVIIISVYIDF